MNSARIVIANFTQTGSIGIISLPKTGQTKCYNATGSEMNCSGTGQDGEIQAGVDWPDPRFVVNGDCVTDKLTGLIWAKNENLAGSTKTWQGTLDYIASLNSSGGLCGYTDWRLPNVNELGSFINSGESNALNWLYDQGFNNIQFCHYWTSSTGADNSNSAWYIDMLLCTCKPP